MHMQFTPIDIDASVTTNRRAAAGTIHREPHVQPLTSIGHGDEPPKPYVQDLVAGIPRGRHQEPCSDQISH
jgi:hypothetical protein